MFLLLPLPSLGCSAHLLRGWGEVRTVHALLSALQVASGSQDRHLPGWEGLAIGKKFNSFGLVSGGIAGSSLKPPVKPACRFLVRENAVRAAGKGADSSVPKDTNKRHL